MADDASKIRRDIIKVCKIGCTKENIMKETHLSHDQLKRITAEIVDKGFLRYIEHQRAYITTDKDIFFLIVEATINKIKHTSQKQTLFYMIYFYWKVRYSNTYAKFLFSLCS